MIYYDTMTEDRPNFKYCTEWENKLNDNIEWNCTFKKKKSGNYVKMVSDYISTHNFGHKYSSKQMGIEKDDACSFCEQERGSLDHILLKM